MKIAALIAALALVPVLALAASKRVDDAGAGPVPAGGGSGAAIGGAAAMSGAKSVKIPPVTQSPAAGDGTSGQKQKQDQKQAKVKKDEPAAERKPKTDRPKGNTYEPTGKKSK